MSFAAENMMQSLGGQAGRSSAENGTQGPGERQRGGSRRPCVLQGALLQRAQAPGRCSPPWLRVCGDWDAEIKNERKNPYHPSLPKYIYVHLHPFGCVFQHLQCFPDYLERFAALAGEPGRDARPAIPACVLCCDPAQWFHGSKKRQCHSSSDS